LPPEPEEAVAGAGRGDLLAEGPVDRRVGYGRVPVDQQPGVAGQVEDVVPSGRRAEAGGRQAAPLAGEVGVSASA